jgi:hypothetical protein
MRWPRGPPATIGAIERTSSAAGTRSALAFKRACKTSNTVTSMSDLVSKVSASGLSAGVFLLWWPSHIPSQGTEVLLLRGVLWALAFEVLLIAFRPLERAIAGAVRGREAGALAPRRIAPLLALAAVAAAAPVMMLCGARAPIAAPARAAAPEVIVKREILRREVVVRRVSRVVRVPVPTATPATTAPAPAPTAVGRTAVAPKATIATKKRTATKAAATADTKADLPTSTVTTTKPAAPAAATTTPAAGTPTDAATTTGPAPAATTGS